MSEPNEVSLREGQVEPPSKSKGITDSKLWDRIQKWLGFFAALLAAYYFVFEKGREDERRHQELLRNQERLEKLSLDLRGQVQFINDYFLLPEFYERCTKRDGVPDRNQKACNMPDGHNDRFTAVTFQELVWESQLRPDSPKK